MDNDWGGYGMFSECGLKWKGKVCYRVDNHIALFGHPHSWQHLKDEAERVRKESRSKTNIKPVASKPKRNLTTGGRK